MEPIYTATTERIYKRLPEYLRIADARNDWTLKRWFSCISDQVGFIEDVVQRINYWPVTEGGAPNDTSDLVDPDTANPEWLAWIGQMVGVRLGVTTLSVQAQRDLVHYASSGWRGGTKSAIAGAAKSVLSGTRYARVYDHSTDESEIGEGGEWDVLVVTRSSETPSGADVLDAIRMKNAKPSGVVLWHRPYNASWRVVFRDTDTSTPGKYASWAALEADGGTWLKIQEAGL
jgi:hypothetical protein